MGSLTPHRMLRGLSGLRTWTRKKTAQVKRKIHITWVISLGMLSIRRPLMVNLIPMRRCNLACAYCNEYDDFSKPVPLDPMYQRIDKLASFGTAIIIISGGEPLLHPQLDQIIAHIRERGIVAGLLSNGYLLTEKRIKRLNAAGLEFFQISVDNINPDDVSKKSLKVLDQKLVLLSRFAEFGVNINSGGGGGIKHPEDSLVVARRGAELGFTTSVAIIHDGKGQVKPLSEGEERIYRTIKKLGKKNYRLFNGFEENLVRGKPNEWRCRAGSRYLYIDENGLVHYCSQQRGYPGVPLESYTQEDMRREYFTKKACAPNCALACVHRVSVADGWRHPQTNGRRAGARSA